VQPARGQDCTPDPRRAVDAIYQQVLERGSSGEGGEKVAQLRQGQTSVREIVREFAKSAEHRSRFLGGGPPAAENATTSLYRHLLGRAPDAAGLKGYAPTVAAGKVDDVIDSLIDSTEYQQNFGDDTVPGSHLRYCPGAATSANTTGRRMRFGNMDRNNNGIIERGEWDGTRGSFSVHDWNRDGVLSGDEVRPGARRTSNAADEDFNPAISADWTDENFRFMDRNSDNRLTASEWYYSPEYFRRADWNRDGWLSLGEFTEAQTDDDRDDQFVNLDVNGNGRIERREWHGSADAFSWLDRNKDSVLSREEVVGTTSEASGFDSFTGLDANGNGRLEPGEWRWSRRSFELSDTNGDGILTRWEFTSRSDPSAR
jgi:Ca2+-binding EF-hand superfamily protein